MRGWPRAKRTLAGAYRFAKETFQAYRQLDCNRQAAAISYYAILSFMPFMILLLSILGFVLAAMGAEGESKREFLNALVGPAHHIAPFLRQELLDQLVQIVEVRTVTGLVGFFAVLFSASLVFGALETSLDQIFLVPKSRHFVISKLLFIGFIGALVVLVLVGHYFLLVVNSWLSAVDQPPLEEAIYSSALVGMLISLLGTVIVFIALVRYFCRMSLPWKSLLVGSLLFFVLFEISKRAFIIFLKYFAQFNVVYGSLSTLMVMIVWVFYTSSIFLLSAVAIRVMLDGEYMGRHVKTLYHYYAFEPAEDMGEPAAPAGGPLCDRGVAAGDVADGEAADRVVADSLGGEPSGGGRVAASGEAGAGEAAADIGEAVAEDADAAMAEAIEGSRPDSNPGSPK